MTKKFFVSFLFGLGFFSWGLCQSQPKIEVKQLEDPALVDILNNAELKKVNTYLPKESVNSTLALKIYSLPVSGNCAVETEAICGYRHYLAVREEGEAADQTVFDLGVNGYLMKVSALPVTKYDQAKLSLRFREAYSEKDVPSEWTVKLDVTAKAVREFQ